MRRAPYSGQRVSTKPLAIVLSLGVLFVLGAPRLAIAESTVVIEANGATQHVIDLVYVAEGYVAADKAQFLADAEVVHQGLVSSAPFAQMRQLISARALFVTSAERGSDHPRVSSGTPRSTAPMTAMAWAASSPPTTARYRSLLIRLSQPLISRF